MVVTCPHCKKQLKLNEKVKESINSLGPGKHIKVKCVHCSQPFKLDRQAVQASGNVENPATTRVAPRIRPPAPPQIEWLKDGFFEDKEIVEDIPRALVLFPAVKEKEIFVKAAEEFGYLVEQVATPEEAIDKMRFVNYSAVFLHEDYEAEGVDQGLFHQYMRQLNMSRRRYIFYVIIGERFRTLYDLEALSFSANLVVNIAEASYIATLLRKTIPEYEDLFGPVMEELRIAGK